MGTGLVRPKSDAAEKCHLVKNFVQERTLCMKEGNSG